jgi:hypothetical protein
VHGSDYSRSNCDTADGSICNCELFECTSERAINSLDPIRREVICRFIHQTRDNMYVRRHFCFWIRGLFSDLHRNFLDEVVFSFQEVLPVF